MTNSDGERACNVKMAAWMAIDVGGANLKASDGRDFAVSRPFALWKSPELLADELAALIDRAPQGASIAATMTGELCDCFRTKADGVRSIMSALEQAARGRRLTIYLVDGRLVSPAEAAGAPLLAAASNWHALATYAARLIEGRSGILIDVGSTTADVIPLVQGHAAAIGTNDTERLAAGELVYTGVERTPVCSILRRFSWRGRSAPLAAEVFATSLDAYLLLGDVAEAPGHTETADGRPRTIEAAHARMARMICGDTETVTLGEAKAAAGAVAESQLDALEEAAGAVMARLPGGPEAVVMSGQGEFLGRRLADRIWPDGGPELISLAARIGAAASRCAPAFALAVLARESAA